MSEMVERVANIIARADAYCGGPAPCVQPAEDCDCVKTARTIIKAMRTPTTKMICAAADAEVAMQGYPYGLGFSGTWTSMIDEALK
jgi:hypothetical protein